MLVDKIDDNYFTALLTIYHARLFWNEYHIYISNVVSHKCYCTKNNSAPSMFFLHLYKNNAIWYGLKFGGDGSPKSAYFPYLTALNVANL